MYYNIISACIFEIEVQLSIIRLNGSRNTFQGSYLFCHLRLIVYSVDVDIMKHFFSINAPPGRKIT